jgi:hypothetical protein
MGQHGVGIIAHGVNNKRLFNLMNNKGRKITMKCKWKVDTIGFYILPLIGISRVKGVWSFWVGWGFWLWTWEFNKKGE